MAGTYLSVLLIILASAGLGDALMRLSGRAGWSWIAPAVGLGPLVALAWGLVNVTGEPVAAAVLVAVAAIGGALVLVVRRAELAAGVPVLVGGLVLASLPFLVEGRFGILGTSLNPDMSQHLFAADRLASGGVERLIAEGYPLGPHALVAGLAELGPSLVHGFGGLTVAVALIASLAPLGVLRDLPVWRRALAALLVGFAYMTASYLIQGAFKETMQALFVLAFALALHELGRTRLAPGERGALVALPLAALAVGAVYTYSFPGLAWLLGGAGIWALAELAARRSLAPLRSALAPAALASVALALATAPELGRILDFAEFETFDPDGAGLGNLFNPISPLEALGIWPSGDFRLDPGAGFAPAVAFWLGGVLALTAIGYGVVWWLRRSELAVPSMLAAATLLYLYPLVAGTPYQEAKAIAIAAPLAMLVAVRALAGASLPDWRGLLAVAFAGAAAACSVLALANGPVGPDEWGPDLIELRQSGELGPGGEDGDDTLIVAPPELLVEEHGEDLLLWELRGGNVCVAAAGSEAGAPPGAEHVVRYRGPGSIEVAPAPRAAGGADYPFVADGARADPAAAERTCPE